MNGPRRPITGQSLTELALLLPILAMLMVGAIDLGRIFYTKVVVANSARVAAEYAVNPNILRANGDDLTAAQNSVKQRAIDEASPFITLDVGDVSFNGTFQPNTKYTVTVTTYFVPITPLIGQLFASNPVVVSHSVELRHNCTASSGCSY